MTLLSSPPSSPSSPTYIPDPVGISSSPLVPVSVVAGVLGAAPPSIAIGRKKAALSALASDRFAVLEGSPGSEPEGRNTCTASPSKRLTTSPVPRGGGAGFRDALVALSSGSMGVKARRCGLQDLRRRCNPLNLIPLASASCFPQGLRLQRKVISPLFLFGSTLFVLGLVSLLTGHIVSHREWYLQLRRPWDFKQGLSHRDPIDIWKSKYSKVYYGCSRRGPHFKAPVSERKSNGYLLIAASGGLNQQRNGIVDAVIVARILNATLVVPELDHHSFWKDYSDFAHIFDADWFISSLSKDVKIVKRIPDKVMRSMERPPYTMRAPRRSAPEYYLDFVLPILLRRRAVQLTKFDYRLANDIDDELQKLRCRVNYHALRFTKPIQDLGQKLVWRMKKMASRFIAVHLRFEADMLAFSGCYYGGGQKERKELGEIRKRWENLPDLNAEGERSRGKCPLTPHEVGLMLRGLGFGNDTYLYVASGEIYGGEATLQPLRKLFPNFYTKEMLADQELKPFIPFSSRLAAIDYVVCYESDVFVTNNNGNMAKILSGHRRYMGHKRSIRPNAKKLSSLFKARNRMRWETFARKVQSVQRGFMGEPDEMRPGKGDFHEFPYSCICQKSEMDKNAENAINFTGERATKQEGWHSLEGSREDADHFRHARLLKKATTVGKASSRIAN